MPRFDGTGPQGLGPLTGRGLGPCNKGMRRGAGRGFGKSFGYGYAESVVITPENEKKLLEAELKEIELEKQEIEKRLKEIK
ncbi:hypothetical protein FJZ20_00555 [Candidatus Pacearchaeota archaeon]|nr:hypothetical protein [Candidatus Pacearchaeota archaeon]